MIVVERLTVRVWLLVVWPRLAWQFMFTGVAVHCCYVIDGSVPALLIARLSGRPIGVSVERLVFRLVDVRDDTGLLIRLRIAYRDLAEAQACIVADPTFAEFLSRCPPTGRLSAYVTKALAYVSWSERATFWRLLLLVEIAAWKARQIAYESVPTLVAERRPWGRALRYYAARHGINLIQVAPAFDLRTTARTLAGQRAVSWARALRNVVLHRRALKRESGASAPTRVSTATRDVRAPRIAVSYHGHFSLNDPAKYSDMFFWQQSALAGRDLLFLFEFPHDPLDADKLRQLNEHGIDAVALYPGAATVAEVPLYTHVPALRQKRRDAGDGRRPRDLDEKWLGRVVEDYELQRDYWRELLQRQGAKIYVSWYRYDARHFVIADALQSLGGVTAIYQRAHQRDAAPEIMVHADVMFGYAPGDADVERGSGSVISYHVAVGYFGDHRFPLLRSPASALRAQLQSKGATYVVAYFDENSGDDSRWHTGHEFMRHNYVFVLEQLLADPSLGLVLKPKFPSTLRRRLGPAAALLERALATGRCYLFEEGPLHGSQPPAIAALAADVAIHGHLCAATAGLEAALAGVPTLLIDREGWHVSQLYELGVGRVVFTQWAGLWQALAAHRQAPGSIPGFGDWSPILADLDPFRDGRAAERMGTYLLWLLDGFKTGARRDTVLADAAERYCARWGADKITAVNCGVQHRIPRALQASTA